MSIIQGSAMQGATRGFYPRVIEGSLRFNDDDSAYLSWTPDSAGNRKTWTWSAWVKRSGLGTYQRPFQASIDANNRTELTFFPDNTLEFFTTIGGVHKASLKTQALFRDPSAWYHLVVVLDAVNTSLDIYVNGVLQTLTTTTAVVNTDHMVSSTNVHTLGRYNPTGASYFDGYLADVHFIDGQALDADNFGETKNGVWVAKDYTGTYGTNGFLLTFEDDTEVEAFNTVLWRGDGTDSRRITGMGFQPDLVWVKERNGTEYHNLADAVRGSNKLLFTNATNAEVTDANRIESFDSDGFTIGTDSAVNTSGDTYVAWGWKAGDSNVSNTDGSITSTVRANDTYGFSIVSYSGTETSGATIGHGLSSAPDMIIVKRRNASTAWAVYHSGLDGGTSPENYYLYLNATDAETADSGFWNNTAPTSSVITLGNYNTVNGDGDPMIAYCWAEKSGYSKFGSYTGDGTSDGSKTLSFGFKPAFFLYKRTDASGNNWNILDNTRDVTNPADSYISPNTSNAEASANLINFTDNGIEFVNGGSGLNASGGTYIYAAFADTREAAFWLDQSGNDNDWQPVNLDHNDTVADSPTDNFATFNAIHKTAGTDYRTLSDGNLKVTGTSTANNGNAHSTIAVSEGKYYAEITCTDYNSSYTVYPQLGVQSVESAGRGEGQVGYRADSYAYFANGQKATTNGTGQSYGDSWTTGDTIGIALDLDNGAVYFSKNGTWQNSGDPSSGASRTGAAFTWTPDGTEFLFSVAVYTTSNELVANFGQQPFKYDPPE